MPRLDKSDVLWEGKCFVEAHLSRDTIRIPILSQSHRVKVSVCLDRVRKLAAPRREGRLLWRWPFAEFCAMLTLAVTPSRD